MKKEILFTLLAFGLIAVVNMLFGNLADANGILLALATVGGQWNPSTSAYRDNLETKLHKTVIEKSKFGALTSVFSVSSDPGTSAPTYTQVKGTAAIDSSVVTVVQNFAASKRGIKVEIPYKAPLVKKGVTGTDTLSGKGERKRMYYTWCAINMRRHALATRDNEMSEQVLPVSISVAQMESAGEDLKDWAGRLLPFEYYYSLLEGYSRNLTDSSFGLGYSKRSHPHTYVQGDGRVDWSVANTFNAGYETNVATALATLTDVSADHFTSQSIRNMVFLADKHKIKKVKAMGKMVYIILISPAQARQLRKDSDWISAWKEAGERDSKNNAIFSGGLDGVIYEGALVLVDSTIPAARISGDTNTALFGEAYDSDMGTVHYGMTEYLETPRDISPRKPAILLGQNGIAAATGKKLKLTQEVTDHGQTIEDGVRMFYGATRPDLIDTDGYGGTSGVFYENTSSLVYWTYSPDEITI